MSSGADESFGDPRLEPWWETLAPSERIVFRMTEVLCLLGQIGAEVRTSEGRSLRWMEKSLDCAFADADRILQKLEGESDP
jgi:hypothetical protein